VIVAPWQDGEQADSLLRLAGGGDVGAVDRLLALYRPALVRFVGSRLHPRLRPRVDESDVVQEACHEAARRIPDYLRRRPMPFRLWLRRIAYDRLLMEQRRHLRAARRSVDREAPPPDQSSLNVAAQLPTDDSSPSVHVCRAEAVESLRQAMERLSESDQGLVLLRMAQNVPYDEIGVILECTPETARKRYARALARLYQELKSHGRSEA
jgi:RNA polymerase sigma-70 factor (ECF subfamily)